MKKLLCSPLIRTAFAVVVTLGLARFMVGAERKEARVTQIIRDVKLLPSQAAPRPASVNDNVRAGTAVRTGGESRAELTFADQTLTRLGANTIFSFTGGARQFDLGGGAVLLCVPPDSGAARINTAAVTAAITGGIALVEFHKSTAKSSKSEPAFKLIILEGNGRVCLKNYPGQCQDMHAGQMIIIMHGAQTLPPIHDVDLDKLLKTAGLVTQWQLPNWANQLIWTEAKKQQDSPPPGGFVDHSGFDAVDQRTAADVPPTPRPHRTGEPTPRDQPR